MTRLKDALEKAARTPGAASGSPTHYSVPPQVVPDAWQLDDHAQADAIFDTLPVETPTVEVAAPPVQTPAAAAPQSQRAEPTRGDDRSADFWNTYQFGERAVGKVVVGPHAHHGLVEQYRRLGAALHHHQLQTGARTLMVTSAVASEGKTLTSTNLALTLSHSYQRRVLLMDADLRRPSLHHLLRVDNSIGLTHSLRRPDTVSARFQTVSPTLSVLTAGRADSDPMAGLTSETMRLLLDHAVKHFDWVIVDTPPVALLPDANLLAAMIDSALIVVGAAATPYPLVRRAVEAIGDRRILGVVLNRMAEGDIVRAYNYYGYGQYAYGAMKRRGRSLKFWGRSKPQPAPKAEATAV